MKKHLKQDFINNQPPFFPIVAYFLIAYTQWVLDQSKKAGIKRLYFIARDGQILLNIAKQLIMKIDTPPELHYLYGSRKAWLIPSLDLDSFQCLDNFIQNNTFITANDLLKRFQLPSKDIEKILSELNMPGEQYQNSITNIEAKDLISQILENPCTKNIFLCHIKEKRSLAIEYFNQEGLFEDISWAIVDTGWVLNCQAALKQILSHTPTPHQPPEAIGFYIGFSKKRLPKRDTGKAYAFITNPGSFISRRAAIIEHCFTPANHPTTIGYEQNNSKIIPILDIECRTKDEIIYAENLIKAAKKYAHIISNYSSYRANTSEYRKTAIKLVEKFIRSPSPSEITKLRNIGVISDLDHSNKNIQPLCRSLTFTDIIRLIISQFPKYKYLQNAAPMWLEASAIISPYPIKILTKLLIGLDNLRYKIKALGKQ